MLRFPLARLCMPAVFCCLGIFILLTSSQWVYATSEGPGPGFLPFWYGVVILTLAGVVFIGELRSITASKGSFAPGVVLSGRPLLLLVSLAVAAAALEWLGFFLTFGLLVTFQVKVIFGKSTLVAFVCGLFSGLTFYVLFELALNLTLPAGVLEF
jgi:putative tricarboxylic transport membrane protein